MRQLPCHYLAACLHWRLPCPAHTETPLPLAGTIEEIVYQRQLYKQQQANVAVEGQDEFRFFEGELP